MRRRMYKLILGGGMHCIPHVPLKWEAILFYIGRNVMYIYRTFRLEPSRKMEIRVRTEISSLTTSTSSSFIRCPGWCLLFFLAFFPLSAKVHLLLPTRMEILKKSKNIEKIKKKIERNGTTRNMQ
jgi:hypothetical protein